jgi:hypothetical protein
MKPTSKLKSLLGVAVACAAASLADTGQAGILGSTSIFGDSVTISYNGAQTATTAGAFEGATFNGLSIPNFWCIDITHHVPYPPWTIPNYTQAPFQSAPLNFTSTQVSNLKTLFAQDYSSVSSFLSATNVAAFQLAIWDLLFDDDNNLSTTATGFGVVSITDTAALIEAQNWVNSADNPSAQQNFTLTQLTNSDGHQAFVFPGPPREELPEPTDLALLGAGLAAMMFGLWRRRSAVPSA